MLILIEAISVALGLLKINNIIDIQLFIILRTVIKIIYNNFLTLSVNIHSRTEMLVTKRQSENFRPSTKIKSAIRPKIMQYLARPYLKK